MTSLPEIQAAGKAGLARILTSLETSPHDPAVIAVLDAAFDAPKGMSLGLTGPPGVGKSTLTNQLVRELRKAGQSIAVIAIDPSSARSQGALLGDRTRIETDPEDAGVFLRSMAARDRLGGVADITYPAMILMQALFDFVLVETVGVGQSEMEIAELADATIFCAQPGSGDALQFMKAGIMEVPDLVLVTKSDMGQVAQRAATDIKGALGLNALGETPEVLLVSSQSGEGISQAVDAMRHLAGVAPAERRGLAAKNWMREQVLKEYGRFGLSLIKMGNTAEKRPFGETSELLANLGKQLQSEVPSS